MTKAEKQWWEQVRAKGCNRYQLHSVLRVGLPFGIFVTAFAVLMHWLADHPLDSFLILAIKFIIYSLGFGSVMGLSNWRHWENEYAKSDLTSSDESQ